MTRTKRNYNYYIFILIFYLIIFRELLENYLPIFRYLDELISCMAIPIAIKKLYERHGLLRIRKNSYPFWVGVAILFALAGNIVYGYQDMLKAVLPDLLLNLKFWLSIYVGITLFKSINLSLNGGKIANHIKAVVWLYVLLLFLDKFLNLFPGDYRYGMKSTFLFYGLHTIFCAMCVFLLALLLLVKDKTRHFTLYSVILLLLMASTMRSKAFGGVILYILLYYLINVYNKKIKLKSVILIGCLCLLIGWSQIQYYFFSSISDGVARNVLLRTSFDIAKEHFPLGAGVATFASHYSGVVYSPLYSNYGISNIYGLTRDHPSFVSDSFWPMEIAQNGYLGAACFIMALYKLFVEISKIKIKNRNAYFSALFALGYLCVSSLAESAFVHSLSIPIALVIGGCLTQAHYVREDDR